MAVYKGTIAGIGDKHLGANLIKPEFDAKIYNFIIGKNCIIDGLDITGNILNAGMCVVQGYRGELKSPIILDSGTYVYGVFKVNFNSDILDEFYIETSTTEIKQKDDILHGAGTYYLLLYRKLFGTYIPHVTRGHPANAVFANNTDHINDNGTLGKDVTAPTQPLGTSNKTPATTEFVRNQINEEIARAYADINIGAGMTIRLLRKATNVVGQILYTGTPADDGENINQWHLPEGFAPAGNTEFITVVRLSSSESSSILYTYQISAGSREVNKVGSASAAGINTTRPVFGWSTVSTLS